MIVSRLFGGLGNQMFQYAFGFALSQRFNVPVYYDLQAFGQYKDPTLVTPRNFSLNCFSLHGTEWPAENNRLFFPENSLWSRMVHQWQRRTGRYALLYERQRGYDPSVVQRAKANSYLVGYWQSPDYFSGIGEALRSEFQFVNLPASGYPDTILNGARPVAVHVRRGDYASNAAVLAKHGLLGMDYYRKAIHLLQQESHEPLQFFIFSDDAPWCREAFAFLPDAIITETSHLPHWYDMYLMTLCQHHIIANSSYSWWGAWLAKHDHQKVIAPAQWQTGKSTGSLMLTPAHWHLI